MSTIRVVLAEDHDIVREGLRRLLESESDMEVVGEAVDGLAVLDVVERTRPDVVLMDLSMPQLNGIEATRRIASEPLNQKVICLSVHSERKMIGAMLQAGASGYLLKHCTSHELTEAIRTTVSGGTYLSPAI
ncbi:MAG: response regulator transcription factor, partial [Planctomycetota bacterium]